MRYKVYLSRSVLKGLRTGVEMIEKYYAARIKNAIDASAVNVRRERRNLVLPKDEIPAD